MRPLKKICAALLAAVTALTALHIGTLTTRRFSLPSSATHTLTAG